MHEEELLPIENLSIRVITPPKDTNTLGDIFGGWLVSQMDLAAFKVATRRCQGRAVTVAIDSLTFHKPVFVGDEVSCYARIVRVGKTSMAVKVDVWVSRGMTENICKVTEGTFTFVAIDAAYHPRKIQQRKVSLRKTEEDDWDRDNN